MAEPKGVCLACGAIELTLRWDRHGRPFCKCLLCGTHIFAHGHEGAVRFLARSIVDARTKDFKGEAVENEIENIIVWMQNITQGAPMPKADSAAMTLEDLIQKRAEKQRTKT